MPQETFKAEITLSFRFNFDDEFPKSTTVPENSCPGTIDFLIPLLSIPLTTDTSCPHIPQAWIFTRTSLPLSNGIGMSDISTIGSLNSL